MAGISRMLDELPWAMAPRSRAAARGAGGIARRFRGLDLRARRVSRELPIKLSTTVRVLGRRTEADRTLRILD